MEKVERKTYKESRPWGGFSQFTHNQLSTVKILEVKSGQMNSLQYHHNREELWVPLDNNSSVTVGDKTFKVSKFEEVFIGKEQNHRLIGSGEESGFVMEISFGNFDENDIVRVEDSYGRA
ncbi:MAG: mannose-6-phosphate isomerase I [uncultured bacterium]|nr:MAG: mannose-6-phosphate isomerase I [uncultured bacterium]